MDIDDEVRRRFEDLDAARLPSPARCKEIREAAHLSLRQMASIVGVAPMSISYWETTRVRPRPENARRYRWVLEQLEARGPR